ncbi:MAG: ABC transporter substrate-binding protein, partial [Aliifodinibius sp.]|nr:ABC transporter substrate-binding protein [candidate division Zixibacteria bacterium]NIT59581.1 ABC transporter substrate-binding protein [Fodinibius sp.]NIW47074.1 ABC transporter substrate-binding protein [Gammaproteobacteria bacterium]NIR65959.1 ABC transporter substrate-binding protein [candidate division Zixibacteria bacterium]NIS47604.1 ABC transporter substrate-binding protein [candidate division Zixibacteria bacterium]
MKSKITILFIFVLSILLSSCSSFQQPREPLRIAVLPVLDTLPLYVAQYQEYFDDAGIEVELIPVSSAPERDQLLASGKVDGAINELVSVLFFNRDETQIQSVRFARAATTESPVFRILSSSQSEIQSVEELAGIPIGISEGTVIEYLTDRLLQAEGLTEEQIETVSVPGIP